MAVANCLRYAMIIFNALVSIIGLGVVAYGTYLYIRYVETITPVAYVYITIVVTGCIIFLIAFCGCYGASTQNYCLILTYGTVMFLLMIIQTVTAVLILLKKTDILSTIDMFMIKNRDTETFYILQKIFKCCGVHLPEILSGVLGLDSSCCVGYKICTSAVAHGICIKVGDNIIQKTSYVIFGVTGVNLMAVVVALEVASHVRD